MGSADFSGTYSLGVTDLLSFTLSTALMSIVLYITPVSGLHMDLHSHSLHQFPLLDTFFSAAFLNSFTPFICIALAAALHCIFFTLVLPDDASNIGDDLNTGLVHPPSSFLSQVRSLRE